MDRDPHWKDASLRDLVERMTVLLKDPGVLLKGPGALFKDSGVLLKDPRTLLKDLGDRFDTPLGVHGFVFQSVAILAQATVLSSAIPARSMDPVALLLALHGTALRHAALVTGCHFAGLSQLARANRLSSRLTRKCRELDAVSGWVRHVTRPRCDDFLAELASALHAARQQGQCAPSPPVPPITAYTFEEFAAQYQGISALTPVRQGKQTNDVEGMSAAGSEAGQTEVQVLTIKKQVKFADAPQNEVVGRRGARPERVQVPVATKAHQAVAEEGAAVVSLVVKDQQGSAVRYKIKKSTPLRKMMDVHCGRSGLQASQVHFMVDGERAAPRDTAEDLGLEDEDLIDVRVSNA